MRFGPRYLLCVAAVGCGHSTSLPASPRPSAEVFQASVARDPLQGWVPVTIDDVQAKLPADVKVLSGESGGLPIHMAGTETADGQLCVVSIIAQPPGQTAEATLERVRETAFATVGGKQLTTKPAAWAGMPGLEIGFTATSPTRGLQHAYFDEKHSRVISIVVIANESWDPDLAAAFLDSLTLVSRL